MEPRTGSGTYFFLLSLSDDVPQQFYLGVGSSQVQVLDSQIQRSKEVSESTSFQYLSRDFAES